MDIKASARKLYTDTFGNSEGFDDKLFDLFFDKIRYVTHENQVVSMLFEIPCTLVTNKGERSVCYVFAVATHPNHRGKGYASDLVKNSCNRHSLVILRPVEDSLFDFYGKLGFTPHPAIDSKGKITPYITGDGDLVTLCEDEIPTEMGFRLMYKGDLGVEDEIRFPYSMA